MSRWTRRRVLAVIGAGIAAAVVVSVALPALAPDQVLPTAAALTYRPVEGTSSGVLADLATKAAAQPAPPGSGPYHYLRTRSWSLGLTGTSDADISGARIAVYDRELWLQANGTGRLQTTQDGGPVHREEITGGLELGRHTPETLRTAQETNPPAAQWFDLIAEVWSSQVVTPQTQNALLTTLATRPDVTIEGETTDRMGRKGIAFSTPNDNARSATPNERLVLVFDPTTGALLDQETVATESGGLPINTPTSTGYTVWLVSGFTPNTDTTP
ncbi:hypothetical protein [Actinokineospora sp. NBRC 105648]|uniref:hypothetical protein n=1 Tax=Actinokineospora sp. NBRC 105648 TaxID=3032206 RepID=UPI002556D44E|nr:hypothetical protein [Actinokineospora sp. NBRC 105648]